MSALGIVRDQPADLVILISIILHGSPTSAVNALMRIQRVLAQHTDSAVMSSNFRSVANHVGGLVDVMVARMARLFDSTTTLGEPANYQLSKHLIHTLNSLCGHPILAESLMVESLTFAFKELTRRLLETTESTNVQFKELSRLINMVIIRLFETARRIAVFRALFELLLLIMRPFPTNGTTNESQGARLAELVLKCIWKLAQNIPADLEESILDPTELISILEAFLQSIPPDEWQARATNQVPGGDMPFQTIRLMIQLVVDYLGDEVYCHLFAAFDDPSVTIIHLYIYLALNPKSPAATAITPPIEEPATTPSAFLPPPPVESVQARRLESPLPSPSPQAASVVSSSYNTDKQRISGGSWTGTSRLSDGGSSPSTPELGLDAAMARSRRQSVQLRQLKSMVLCTVSACFFCLVAYHVASDRANPKPYIDEIA